MNAGEGCEDVWWRQQIDMCVNYNGRLAAAKVLPHSH